MAETRKITLYQTTTPFGDAKIELDELYNNLILNVGDESIEYDAVNEKDVIEGAYKLRCAIEILNNIKDKDLFERIKKDSNETFLKLAYEATIKSYSSVFNTTNEGTKEKIEKIDSNKPKTLDLIIEGLIKRLNE